MLFRSGSVAASCSSVFSRSVVSPGSDRPNATAVSVFKVGNDAGVSNGGTPTTVSLNKDTWMVDLWTYHWNNGRGQPAGKTAMIAADGTVYGPWQTELVNGVYWVAKPQTWLKAGSYTVCDSDPSTWAQNSGTSGQGMAWATGIESVGA